MGPTLLRPAERRAVGAALTFLLPCSPLLSSPLSLLLFLRLLCQPQLSLTSGVGVRGSSGRVAAVNLLPYAARVESLARDWWSLWRDAAANQVRRCEGSFCLFCVCVWCVCGGVTWVAM